MIKAIFVMEQHIGHRAYYLNLRDHLDKKADICAEWVPITFVDHQSNWNSLPLPANLRGTMIGRDQVLKTVKKGDADVFFFNTQVPAALAGGTVYKKPYVLATDITPLQYDQMGAAYDHRADRFNFLARYKHRVNVRLFQQAAWLLPWSQWAAESIIQDYGTDPGRVEVLAPGVDLERWRPSDRVPSEKMRILFVGGDFNRKGGELLLQACQPFIPQFVELHIVTRTPLEPQPGVQVYRDMLPNSEALVQLYQTSDIFALPSQAEAFGIAAVEASACGLPALVTRVGGLQNIVVDGETGFLVPPGDAGALASKLQILTENLRLRQKMSIAARKRAETYYDAQRNASRVAEILHEVVGVGQK